SGTPVLIDGVTILVSRLAPVCCLAPRTMQRLDDHLHFELPIGLATDAWIQHDLGPLAAFASAVRDGLACLGLTVCASDELLRLIAFQGPLDGHGSLMNIGGPNRVFDALFRCTARAASKSSAL
ncbi:MAG: hypothetical protein NT062_36790, partial [Proteobacteria bacterium]|nr:hypothetical protein [Pseudomonadota bacterium]